MRCKTFIRRFFAVGFTVGFAVGFAVGLGVGLGELSVLEKELFAFLGAGILVPYLVFLAAFLACACTRRLVRDASPYGCAALTLTYFPILCNFSP